MDAANVDTIAEKISKRNDDGDAFGIVRPVIVFLKRNWARFVLAFATFAAVSAVVYFGANRGESVVSYSAGELEVGQIAFETIVAPKTMRATEMYPIEIIEGEKIVKKGFPVTEEALLKLRKLSDSPTQVDYRSIGNVVFFLILVCALWIVLFSPVILGKRAEMRELVLECVLFFLTFFFMTFSARAIAFQSPFRIVPVIPSVLALLLVAILFGQKSAFLYSVVLAAGVLGAGGFEVVPALFTFATGLSSARIVRKIEKRIDIVFASLLQSALGIVFVIVFKVIFNDKFSDIAFVLAGVVLNSFISGILVLGLLTPLENLMNTASVFRLMDLSDTANSPVLRKLLINASGTYNHSMMVSQLAENACREIGANHFLARVAAFYHDIGKLDQPEYFTENQSNGENKHDSISPSMSASIIKSHVKKGVEMARKMHLPSQVIDIIAEHHGNSVIAYFYAKAKEIDPSVSETDFSYPGTPPVTKESAVVMLADTAEAACRSLDKPSVSRIEKFIQTLIDAKVAGHQLEKCGLTFGELSLIKESFVQVLAGHYHSRTKYPNQKDPDEGDGKEEKEEGPAQVAGGNEPEQG